MTNPEIDAIVQVRYQGADQIQRYVREMEAAGRITKAQANEIVQSLNSLRQGSLSFVEAQQRIATALDLSSRAQANNARIFSDASLGDASRAAQQLTRDQARLAAGLESTNKSATATKQALEALARTSAGVLGTSDRATRTPAPVITPVPKAGAAGSVPGVSAAAAAYEKALQAQARAAADVEKANNALSRSQQSAATGNFKGAEAANATAAAYRVQAEAELALADANLVLTIQNDKAAHAEARLAAAVAKTAAEQTRASIATERRVAVEQAALNTANASAAKGAIAAGAQYGPVTRTQAEKEGYVHGSVPPRTLDPAAAAIARQARFSAEVDRIAATLREGATGSGPSYLRRPLSVPTPSPVRTPEVSRSPWTTLPGRPGAGNEARLAAERQAEERGLQFAREIEARVAARLRETIANNPQPPSYRAVPPTPLGRLALDRNARVGEQLVREAQAQIAARVRAAGLPEAGHWSPEQRARIAARSEIPPARPLSGIPAYTPSSNPLASPTRSVGIPLRENAARTAATTEQTRQELGRLQASRDLGRISAERIAAEKRVENERIAAARLQQYGPIGGGASGGGGGGGFVGNFSRGFNADRNGNNTPFSQSIGSTLRFSLLYGTAYRALSGIAQGFQETLKEAVDFQSSLTELSITTGRTKESLTNITNTLGETATDFGRSSSEGVRAGGAALGYFRQLDAPSAKQDAVALVAAEALTRLSFVTGQTTDELGASVAALTQAFKLSAGQITQVADYDAFLTRQYAIPTGSTIKGTPVISSLGAGAGYSLAQLQAIFAGVQSRSAGTPAQTSGFLSQILSREGQGATEQIFAEFNITGRTLADRLTNLAEKYNSLGQNDPQQLAIAAAFGKGKSQSAAKAFLEELPRSNKLAAQVEGGAATGLAARQADLRLGNIGGQLRQLSGDFNEFAKEFGQSGFLDVLGLGVKALSLFLTSTNNLLEAWNSMNRVVRDLIIGFVALNVVNRTSLLTGRISAIAGARGFIGPVNSGFTRGIASVTPSAAGRAGASTPIAGAIRGAGTGAAALGLTSPLLYATLGLLAIGGIKNTVDEYGKAVVRSTAALVTSADADSSNAEALRGRADALQADAESRRKQRGAFLGINFRGSQADADANAQQARADEARATADAIDAASKNDKAPPNFGDLGADAITREFDRLKGSGQNAADILDLFNKSIDNTGKIAGAALEAAFDPNIAAKRIASDVAPLAVSAVNNAKDVPFVPKGFPKDEPVYFPGSKFSADVGRALPAPADIEKLVSDFIIANNIQTNKQLVDSAPKIADSIVAQIPKGALPAETLATVNKLITDALVTNIANGFQTGGNDTSIDSRKAYEAVQKQLEAADAARARLSPFDTAGAAKTYQGTIRVIRARLQQVAQGDPTKAILDELTNATAKYAEFKVKSAQQTLQLAGQSGAKDVIAQGQALLPQLISDAAEGGDFGTLVTLLKNAGKAATDLALSELRKARDLAFAAAGASKDRTNLRKIAQETYKAGLQAVTQATLSSDTQPEVDAAKALANASPQSPTAQARAQLKGSQAALDKYASSPDTAGKTGKEYWNLVGDLNQKKEAVRKAIADEATAIKDTLGARVGGQLAQSISALNDAQKAMDFAVGDAEKNAAKIGLLQAQAQNRDALANFRSNARKLSIDMTNPLEVAQEEVRTAVDRLNEDLKRLAPGGYSQAEQDVINSRRLDVKAAQTNEESTKFSQRLSQIQTQDQLGQITHQTYLRYLDSEHDRLTAIGKRTQQQQDQLNQVDTLMKEAADALQGQFNLGDIELPSAYQVRRVIRSSTGADLVGGASAPVGGNSITINGADTGQIIQILSQYMGDGASYSITGI